jgi:flavin-dependent dehydrogenase
MSFDLIVIGAGPAGSSAAITAARQGARVLLLEKGSFPRQKVCGEFVSAESLGLLASLLQSSNVELLTDCVKIQDIRLIVDGYPLLVRLDSAAASIARTDLDLALWKAASACGVETLQKSDVRSVQQSADMKGFTVSTAKDAFEGRSVVQCCGRWSNLNVAPGYEIREKWLGVKAHFLEYQPSERLDLYFFDGGYCGVQPVSKPGPDGWASLNVCAMVRADRAASLEQILALEQSLTERSKNWRAQTLPISTSPLVFWAPEPVRESLLQAGDAVAFVDPFVGDGISLALRSGALAADCLIPFLQNEVSQQQAVEDYRRLHRLRFSHVYRNSSRVRKMLSAPKFVRRPLMHLMNAVPTVPGWMVRKTR